VMARTGADEATAPATSWGYWVKEKLSNVTIVTINLQLRSFMWIDQSTTE